MVLFVEYRRTWRSNVGYETKAGFLGEMLERAADIRSEYWSDSKLVGIISKTKYCFFDTLTVIPLSPITQWLSRAGILLDA